MAASRRKRVKLAICVNPLAGRDVRRVAARASTVTHEAKMDIVARIAAGADAIGIDEILVVREPFRIAEQALAWMSLQATVTMLEIKLTHTMADTEAAMRAFLDQGVDHVVALGGDGTQRVVTYTAPDIRLVPLSTGTNNVFPLNVEPTIAGMVAALGARGELRASHLAKRAKIAKLNIGARVDDIGLIDVVRLENDFVGNYRPFKPANLREMVLTRAEPDAIGMSPIGGLVEPVSADEDAALYVKLGPGRTRRVPLAPGHLRDVEIAEARRLPLATTVEFESRGLIAIDGDRLHKVAADESVTVRVVREGAWVYDVGAVMRYATKHLFN